MSTTEASPQSPTAGRDTSAIVDVPRLISVDDHEMAALFDLTTIAQDATGQGRTAAQLLLHEIEGADSELEPPHVLLPTWLTIRGTTAPPSPTHTGLAPEEPT